MKKEITQEKLEEWWVQLNRGHIPKEILINRIDLIKNKKEAHCLGMFNMLSAILTEEEMMRGWNKHLESKTKNWGIR